MFNGLIVYIGVVSFFALLQLYCYIYEFDKYDTKALLMRVFILSYIFAVVLTYKSI